MSWEAGSIYGMKARRRDKHEITAEILSVAREGARPTRIMYKANLSFKCREKYLRDLLGAELIETKAKSPLVYKTTELGEEWLRNYSKARLA